MSNYPDGKCSYCGKVFERPNKFRTENEAFHVYGCELEAIKFAIKNAEEFNLCEVIDLLKRISKVSSFGARPGNKYYERMRECNKIVKELETSQLNSKYDQGEYQMKIKEIKDFVDKVCKEDNGFRLLMSYAIENKQKESSQFLTSETDIDENKQCYRLGVFRIKEEYSEQIEELITEVIQTK